EFAATGFGSAFALALLQDPTPDPAAPTPGTDWDIGMLPSLQTDGSAVALRTGGRAEYFDGGLMGYTPSNYSQDALTEDTGNREFSLVTDTGAKIVFNNFDSSLPTYQKGQVKSMTDPAGNTITVTSRTTDGKPLDLQRTSTTGGVTTTE